MPGTPEEDLQLIMTCLKYTRDRGKPDFEAAAEELGVKAKTLYHRHWSLFKKWGMTGSKAANAGVAASSLAAPATPSRKRGRPASNNGSGMSSKRGSAGTYMNNVGGVTEIDDDDDTPVKKKTKVKKDGCHDDDGTDLSDVKEHVDELGNDGDDKDALVVVELDGIDEDGKDED